jgi:CheY-like chemotaxis protein
VSLGDVVEELRALIGLVLGVEIDLVLSLDPDLGDAIVDREQLEQVLLNLAANARDAMPRGGRLTIGTANVTLGEPEACPLGCSAGEYVVLTVTDTGVGMSSHVRERLFERFFTTKAPGQGTGLGLATAHRFVAQSGGAISVWSEPGAGTSVVAYLPRAMPSYAPRAPSPSSVEPPSGAGTILVVDDDEQVRRVARGVLEERGYDVLDAACGDRALEQVARHHRRVDLVLTDVVLGRMSGRELIDRLKRSHPSLKALFMSGHGDDVIQQHGVTLGRDALLRKAFTPLDLARKVREALIW